MNGISARPHDTYWVGENEKLGHSATCWCLGEPHAIVEKTPLEAGLVKETNGPEHGGGPKFPKRDWSRDIDKFFDRALDGRHPRHAPGDPLPMDGHDPQGKRRHPRGEGDRASWYVEG